MPGSVRPTGRARGAALAALFALASCAGARPQPGAEEGTPVAVTRAFYGALHAGDAAGAARLAEGPHAGEVTAAFVEMAHAYSTVERALAARFGPDAARAVGYAERVKAEDEALRTARAEVKGDAATVLSDDHPMATLRRVRGAWRVELEDALLSGQGLAALAGEARASATAAEKVAPAIRGGLFDDAENALEAFRDELELARGGSSPGELAPEERTGPSPPAAAPGMGGAEL
jgi:hypothetical protein